MYLWYCCCCTVVSCKETPTLVQKVPKITVRWRIKIVKNWNFAEKCGKFQILTKVREITKIKIRQKSTGNYRTQNYKKCGKLQTSKLQKKCGKLPVSKVVVVVVRLDETSRSHHQILSGRFDKTLTSLEILWQHGWQ